MTPKQADILIIDDDRETRMAVKSIITRQQKYNCEECDSAEAALKVLAEKEFDLLLLDIMMPGMSGVEFLERIRKNRPDLGVIMLTGTDDRHLADRAIESGVHGYIIKPFAINEILINIDNALRRIELEKSNRQHQDELEVLVKKRTAELQEALENLQNSQQKIIEQEKMASIGMMAAGIAHEINSPLSYLLTNLQACAKLISRLKQMETEGADGKKKVKFITELEEAVADSIDGSKFIRTIASDLRCFARNDTDVQETAQINDIIRQAANIARNELKYKAELRMNLADLPLTHCFPRQLCQVFINLLVNAAHAIREKGVISIKTGAETDEILIEFSDTGAGISPADLPRVCDPLFTTKEAGKGTGIGLYIASQIISRHHGRMNIDSTPDVGTTVRIILPM